MERSIRVRLSTVCLLLAAFAWISSDGAAAKPKSRSLDFNGLQIKYPGFLVVRQPAVHSDSVAVLFDAKSDGGLFIGAPSVQYDKLRLIEEVRSVVVSQVAPDGGEPFSWKNARMLYSAGTEAGLKKGSQRLSGYDVERVKLQGFNGNVTVAFEYHLLRINKRSVIAGYFFVAAKGDNARAAYENEEAEEPLNLLSACAETIASITGEMVTKVGRNKDGTNPPGGESPADESGSRSIRVSDLLSMFSEGPDYVADMTVAMNGTAVTERVARRGGMIRWEVAPTQAPAVRAGEARSNLKVVTIMRPGEHALVLDTQGQVYAEVPEHHMAMLKPPQVDPVTVLKNAGWFVSKLIIEDAGLAEVDGHQATKVRLRFADDPGELFFYFAKDLKNLFIKMEGGDKTITGSILLSNISLDVPDDLFRVPADYKKTDFYSMVETIGKKIRP